MGGMASTPTITFLGAARNVTGSRFLLSDDRTRILVDCGLYQERDLTARNWEQFPVDPSTLDAVMLTHAHLDHSGYLPRLVADGFRGSVYCTAATADLVQILLEDSARIQTEDAAFKKRRHQRENRKGKFPEVPLYTVDDAVNAISSLSPVEYGESVQVGAFSASFADAGHILGSATLRVEFDGRSIIFSGDLGRVAGPLLHDPESYAEADYVVIESTYGDRKHGSSETASNVIAETINETVKRHGNVLIPSFAVERAQDLLFMLRGMVEAKQIPHLVFFVDSPMATDVTKVFERYPDLLDGELADMLNDGDSPFRFPGLTFVKTVDESKAINNIHGTAVIIAGSGMCTGGRIKHHLVNNLEDPNSVVLFIGYQARGTLGRLLVDGITNVRIQGQPHEVRARIVQVDGMSAHADTNGLQLWLNQLKQAPKKIFVVHGEEESALAFAQTLVDTHGWDAVAPGYGNSFKLA
jgi:metallo-beta-lactamase family protein